MRKVIVIEKWYSYDEDKAEYEVTEFDDEFGSILTYFENKIYKKRDEFDVLYAVIIMDNEIIESLDFTNLEDTFNKLWELSKKDEYTGKLIRVTRIFKSKSEEGLFSNILYSIDSGCVHLSYDTYFKEVIVHDVGFSTSRDELNKLDLYDLARFLYKNKDVEKYLAETKLSDKYVVFLFKDNKIVKGIKYISGLSDLVELARNVLQEYDFGFLIKFKTFNDLIKYPEFVRIITLTSTSDIVKTIIAASMMYPEAVGKIIELTFLEYPERIVITVLPEILKVEVYNNCLDVQNVNADVIPDLINYLKVRLCTL